MASGVFVELPYFGLGSGSRQPHPRCQPQQKGPINRAPLCSLANRGTRVRWPRGLTTCWPSGHRSEPANFSPGFCGISKIQVEAKDSYNVADQQWLSIAICKSQCPNKADTRHADFATKAVRIGLGFQCMSLPGQERRRTCGGSPS